MSNPFNNQNLRDLLEQSQISIGHLRDLGFSDEAIRVIEDLMGATSDSAVDSAREKFTAESQTEAERVGRTQSGAIAVPAVKADPSARVTYQAAGHNRVILH